MRRDGIETASEGQCLVNASGYSQSDESVQAVLAWTRIPFRISRKDWFK